MTIIIIIGFVVIGVIEIWLWNDRPLRDVITYLALLSAGATLSVLLYLDPFLPVPAPLKILLETIKNYL